MMRMLIAGIIGGVILFAWSAISHMLLPFGEMGIDVLPEEEAVLSTMEQTIPRAGFYFFPGTDMSRELSAEERAEWEERYRTGPAGILVYQPVGGEPMPASNLVNELISNVLAALIAAWILTLLPGSFGRRVVVVTALGVIAWLTISASNWIWWGFPASYIVGEGIDTVVGWLLAGLAMAYIVRPLVQPADARYSTA